MPTLTPRERCTILRGVALFSTLPEKDLLAIAELTTLRSVRAREELFHKGDEGHQLYVVAAGRLKVVTTSEKGDDVIFCLVDAGEVIGEVALLTDRERTATVVAMQPCQLLVIDRRDFQDLLRMRPEVSTSLLSVLASRLIRVSEFVEDTQFPNLPVRLAKKIMEVAHRHGRESQDGARMTIELKLSQEEWGDLVGTTRESINKQFRDWTKSGLIEIDKGRIVLLDPLEMGKLAACVVL